MNAPFFAFGMFDEDTSLLVALLIGLGFGFFLERAGFGSARKLVAQFYLRDLAVFKVMFTAIVTAMLGVALLSSIGVLDLTEVYLVPTYWPSQIVGGLLLGAGFVIGGYCPGTSIAAVATGRIDGMTYGLGFTAGTLAFAVLFPHLEGFYSAGSAGELTLPQLLNLPRAVIVPAVVVIAIAGFSAASLIERRLAAREQGAAR